MLCDPEKSLGLRRDQRKRIIAADQDDDLIRTASDHIREALERVVREVTADPEVEEKIFLVAAAHP
jgi:hypothetical protein